MNKCLNVVRSFLHATGNTRSISPSPFSTANQLLHTKLDLIKKQRIKLLTIFYDNMINYYTYHLIVSQLHEQHLNTKI